MKTQADYDRLERQRNAAYKTGRSFYNRNAGGLDELTSAFGDSNHFDDIELGYLDARDNVMPRRIAVVREA